MLTECPNCGGPQLSGSFNGRNGLYCQTCGTIQLTSPAPAEPDPDRTRLLDTFAAAALTGLLSDTRSFEVMGQTARDLGMSPTAVAATAAYEYAQAMLTARSAVLGQSSPEKGTDGQI